MAQLDKFCVPIVGIICNCYQYSNLPAKYTKIVVLYNQPVFFQKPLQVAIWHVLQYHEWSTLTVVTVHSQQTDNVGMTELLHQIYFLHKLL